MRWIGFVAAIAPALAGCSTFPRTEDVTRKSTLAIVHQVRCEAKRAVVDIAYNRNDPDRGLINYTSTKYTPINYTTASIGYEFTFDITEDNNASADATWGLPYTLGGNFSLMANGSFNRIRHTKRNFKITDSFEELYNTDCAVPPPPGVPSQPENLIYPIAGEIGVYEVVKTFIKLQQVDNTKAGEVFTFGDTLMFTTVLSGGVHPKLVISPLPDRFRLAAANGDFSADRTDIHTVVISMAGDKPRDPTTKTAKSVGRPVLIPPPAAVSGLTGVQTNSTNVSTTILQSLSDPRYRALLELDRQRNIALQDKAAENRGVLVIQP
jgi:hypothetical protein